MLSTDISQSRWRRICICTELNAECRKPTWKYTNQHTFGTKCTPKRQQRKIKQWRKKLVESIGVLVEPICWLVFLFASCDRRRRYVGVFVCTAYFLCAALALFLATYTQTCSHIHTIEHRKSTKTERERPSIISTFLHATANWQNPNRQR